MKNASSILFVTEQTRGSGVGAALIDTALEVTRVRGATALTWSTEAANHRAQRLYERAGAHRSEWVDYEIRLPSTDSADLTRGDPR